MRLSLHLIGQVEGAAHGATADCGKRQPRVSVAGCVLRPHAHVVKTLGERFRPSVLLPRRTGHISEYLAGDGQRFLLVRDAAISLLKPVLSRPSRQRSHAASPAAQRLRRAPSASRRWRSSSASLVACTEESQRDSLSSAPFFAASVARSPSAANLLRCGIGDRERDLLLAAVNGRQNRPVQDTDSAARPGPEN